MTNALSRVSPHLAAQWHPTKNGDLGPDDVTTRSDQRAWWKCPDGPAPEQGCPFCSNKRVSVTNALATVAPRVAADWHRRRTAS